jgi:hypothetical protein
MQFEERVRFQVDEADLGKVIGAYRRVHKLMRESADPPLHVELLRVVGDAHSFEERLVFRDRAHFEGSFTDFLRRTPEIHRLYTSVPYVGPPAFAYWAESARPETFAPAPPPEVERPCR